MSDQNESNQPGTHEDPSINTNPSEVGANLEAQQVVILRSMQARIRSLQDRIVAGDTLLAERVSEVFDSLEPIAPWGPEGSNAAPTEADTDADADRNASPHVPSAFYIASMDALSRLYDPSNPLIFDILTDMGNPIQQTLYTGVLSLASFVISRTADRARAEVVQSVLERELNTRSAAQSSMDTNAEQASNGRPSA